jgi:leucine dehydrogenase
MARITPHIAGAEGAIDTTGRQRTGDPSPATAYGVFVGLKAAVKHKLGKDNLRGVRVAIQGVGNVGFGLGKWLHDEGASLVVSDVNADNLKKAQSELDATIVEGDAIYSQDVDVFAPCALGGAINEKSFDLITAPVIAGGANNQLVDTEMGKKLHARGTLYAPDFVINAGGIIHVHYMRTGKSWQASTEHVSCIGNTLSEIFKRSDAQNLCTSEIANQLAEERFLKR